MNDKEQIVMNEIISLVDSFDDKVAIATLLKLAISVGCKYQDNHNEEPERCVGCPLTSYVCRLIHTQANLLMEDEESECCKINENIKTN